VALLLIKEYIFSYTTVYWKDDISNYEDQQRFVLSPIWRCLTFAPHTRPIRLGPTIWRLGGTYSAVDTTSLTFSKRLTVPSRVAKVGWGRIHLVINWLLLLFAIKMATLPFWAEIKNLRTLHREAYRFVNSGRNDMILSDLERYDVGLPEYVKIMRNVNGFRSKEFWAQLPHFPCSISSSILVL
jgi:hypothetical protein